MADFATLSLLVELFEGWEEEATQETARAHRYRGHTTSMLAEERANTLRTCIAEASVLFPAAGDWYLKGVVPAFECDGPDEPDYVPSGEPFGHGWRRHS
jgi:hypothetical protein